LRVTDIKEVNAIPDDALEALARCLFPAIKSYFESEEGKREFAEWQSRSIENLPGREAEPDDKVRLAG
jgi:hypothetical protein